MQPIRNGKLVAKSRNKPVKRVYPASEIRNYPGGGLVVAFGAGEITLRTDDESISYTNRGKGDLSLSNFCIHKRIIEEFRDNGPNVYLGNTVASPAWQVTDYAGNYIPAASSPGHAFGVNAAKTAIGVSLDTALLSTNGLSYINEGYSRMRPDLTEVSVPNFLLELGDIKSLFNLWSGRSGIVKNVANGFLNYNFGWKPTIGDVSAMISSVVNLHLKIENWNKSLGTLVKKRCTILSDTISKSGSLAATPNSGQTTYWNGYATRKVVAYIQYRPCALTQMTLLERELRGLLDSLGFELNPGILWEAIPFSFVVDWFLGVGNYLNGLKIDTLELPIKLVDSFLQYNQSILIDTYVVSAANSSFPEVRYPGAMRSETFFQRMPILPRPEDLFALGWRMPKLKQWALGLALGLTRK
jgi:hypothetical protein